MNKRAAALLLLATPVTAAYAASDNHFDVFYIPSAKMEVVVPGSGSVNDNGEGFGLKMEVAPDPHLLINGEYQTTSHDQTDIDLEQYRIGVGLQSGADPLKAAAYVEYVNQEFDNAETDGFGIHGRLTGQASENVGFYGQIGWVQIEDAAQDKFDGVEYLLGGACHITPTISLLAEYRSANLKDNAGVEINSDDLRLGARVGF